MRGAPRPAGRISKRTCGARLEPVLPLPPAALAFGRSGCANRRSLDGRAAGSCLAAAIRFLTGVALTVRDEREAGAVSSDFVERDAARRGAASPSGSAR